MEALATLQLRVNTSSSSENGQLAELHNYHTVLQISMDTLVRHSSTESLLHTNHICWQEGFFAVQDLDFKRAKRVFQFVSGHLPHQHYLACFGLHSSANFPCSCSCYISELETCGIPTVEYPDHVIWCEDEEIQAARVELDHLLHGYLSLKSLLTQLHAPASFLSQVASCWRWRGHFWA